MQPLTQDKMNDLKKNIFLENDRKGQEPKVSPKDTDSLKYSLREGRFGEVFWQQGFVFENRHYGDLCHDADYKKIRAVFLFEPGLKKEPGGYRDRIRGVYRNQGCLVPFDSSGIKTQVNNHLGLGVGAKSPKTSGNKSAPNTLMEVAGFFAQKVLGKPVWLRSLLVKNLAIVRDKLPVGWIKLDGLYNNIKTKVIEVCQASCVSEYSGVTMVFPVANSGKASTKRSGGKKDEKKDKASVHITHSSALSWSTVAFLAESYLLFYKRAYKKLRPFVAMKVHADLGFEYGAAQLGFWGDCFYHQLQDLGLLLRRFLKLLLVGIPCLFLTPLLTFPFGRQAFNGLYSWVLEGDESQKFFTEGHLGLAWWQQLGLFFLGLLAMPFVLLLWAVSLVLCLIEPAFEHMLLIKQLVEQYCSLPDSGLIVNLVSLLLGVIAFVTWPAWLALKFVWELIKLIVSLVLVVLNVVTSIVLNIFVRPTGVLVALFLAWNLYLSLTVLNILIPNTIPGILDLGSYLLQQQLGLTTHVANFCFVGFSAFFLAVCFSLFVFRGHCRQAKHMKDSFLDVLKWFLAIFIPVALALTACELLFSLADLHFIQSPLFAPLLFVSIFLWVYAVTWAVGTRPGTLLIVSDFFRPCIGDEFSEVKGFFRPCIGGEFSEVKAGQSASHKLGDMKPASEMLAYFSLDAGADLSK